MGKVLVTGGTGYVAPYVARALKVRGHRILMHARRPQAVTCEAASIVLGPTLQVPKGLEAVIALAGAPVACRWTPGCREEILASRLCHVAGIVRQIGEMRPSDRPRTLVVASGSAAWQPADHVQYTAPESFLAKVCRLVEREAQKAELFGVRVIPMRIGPVVGPGAPACPRVLPVLGDGRQTLPWIYIEDLAALAAAVLDCDGVHTLAASAPNQVTQEECARAFAAARGQPWCIVPRVPAWALRLAMGESADEVALSCRYVLVSERLITEAFLNRPWIAETIEDAAELVARAEREQR